MPAPVIAFLNHVLSGAPWAKEALRPFAGRRIAVVTLVGRFLLAIAPDGGLCADDAGSEPDLTIVADPVVLARIATGDMAARADLRVDGDEGFARALWYVASQLDWDYEEDLSRVTGDLIAHRIGETMRTLAATARDSARRVGLAAAEFVTEESRVTPPAAEIAAWLSDVDTLRDDLDRLDQRVARLEHRPS